MDKDLSIFLKLKPKLDDFRRIFCIEKSFCSNEYKFGGTVDLVAEVEFKGKPIICLIDFKTSEKIKSEAEQTVVTTFCLSSLLSINSFLNVV